MKNIEDAPFEKYDFLSNEESKAIFIKKIQENYDYDGIDFFNKNHGRNYKVFTDHKRSRPYILINQNLPIFKDSLIWLLANEIWESRFIYLDGNSKNAIYGNLLPQDFITETEIPDLDIIRSKVEYDEEDRNFYWIYQHDKNRFWNSVFPCELASKSYKGEKYLDLDGLIYKQEEIEKLFLAEKIVIDDEYFDESIDEKEDGNHFYRLHFNDGNLDPNEKVGREKTISCFYCGDDTEITRDHVIPISYASSARHFDRSDTVPCCKECNGLLGNILLTTVEQRANYLADKLASKHVKVLRSFEYSKEEVDDFGERLGSTVKASVFFKSYIAQRINHCHRVAGSLYAPSSVSHLRGITTEARRTVYGLLEDFLNHEASEKEFINTKALELKEDQALIRSIIGERSHIAVSTQLKFDRRYPLDASIRDLRRALLKLALGRI